MAIERASQPITRCMNCTRHDRLYLPLRTLTTTTTTEPPANDPPPPAPTPKKRSPYTVTTATAERQLLAHQNQIPIGSRRRRAAIASTTQIPFAQLPYQCFQEARSFLQQDRAEKLEAIRVQRERIERLRDQVVVGEQDGEVERRAQWEMENRLRSMGRRLEELKVLADINDPGVKKRFEDGQGDLNRPVYRHLANTQWRAYKRRLLLQRITQMNVVPDVLPTIDPLVSTDLHFPALATTTSRSKHIQHGDFVDSAVSEKVPVLNIQPYDRGTRLVTIAVVNPDVPNVEKDGFDHRCHFLAVNVPVTPTETRVPLGELKKSKIIIPWLPAYAQKGAPYQRMSIFILQQPPPSPSSTTTAPASLPASDTPTTQPLDVAAIKAEPRYTTRDSFNLRSFADRFALKPVGVDLFRTKWDEGTAGVMQRAGIVGWDVEFLRKRVEPLPYRRKGGARYR